MIREEKGSLAPVGQSAFLQSLRLNIAEMPRNTQQEKYGVYGATAGELNPGGDTRDDS